MRTRVCNNKEQIFCEWRHRWVRLTPEEWVRQQLLHRLVEQLHYPASLIAVEVSLKLANLPTKSEGLKPSNPVLRADAVIYDRATRPQVLIECKAETVPLTQKTLDQAITYNRSLNVPWLILHNGPQTIAVHLTGDTIETFATLPSYEALLVG